LDELCSLVSHSTHSRNICGMCAKCRRKSQARWA
jgi:hypothetical protein